MSVDLGFEHLSRSALMPALWLQHTVFVGSVICFVVCTCGRFLFLSVFFFGGLSPFLKFPCLPGLREVLSIRIQVYCVQSAHSWLSRCFAIPSLAVA